MTQQVRIVRAWNETPEIKCFELKSPNGTSLPAAEPGAHIDVHLPGNLIRQYSLWNGPEDTESYFIGVKREPQSRGGSTAMHAFERGALLTIGSPKNNFPLVDSEGPHILLAGGIGVTPLLSMARNLEQNGRSYELHLFARDEANTPFAERAKADNNTTVHLGLIPPGLEDVLQGLLADRGPDAHLYMCGPGPFMQLVKDIARPCGWPDDHVHLEYFSVDADSLNTDGDSFDVVLQQAGQTLTVGPEETIIEAMEAAGIEPFTSCEQGVCGTCLCDIIEGEPDHRDQYLNPTERDAGKLFLPCVSRSKGKRIVLDL